MGSAALAAAVVLPRYGDPNFQQGMNEVLKKIVARRENVPLSISSLISPLTARVVWGTTDDFATSFLHFFPVLHRPLGLAERQACPFPNVVYPSLPLSALSSFLFHCALQDGFGQT